MSDALPNFAERAKAAAVQDDTQAAAKAKTKAVAMFARRVAALGITQPVPTDTRLTIDGVTLVGTIYPGVPILYLNLEFTCPVCKQAYLSDRRIKSLADIGRALEVQAHTPHCKPVAAPAEKAKA